MRQLPRVTIRATGGTLATWEAICEVLALPAHEAFDLALSSYSRQLDRADPTLAAKIMRRARAIRRDRYADAP